MNREEIIEMINETKANIERAKVLVEKVLTYIDKYPIPIHKVRKARGRPRKAMFEMKESVEVSFP